VCVCVCVCVCVGVWVCVCVRVCDENVKHTIVAYINRERSDISNDNNNNKKNSVCVCVCVCVYTQRSQRHCVVRVERVDRTCYGDGGSH